MNKKKLRNIFILQTLGFQLSYSRHSCRGKCNCIFQVPLISLGQRLELFFSAYTLKIVGWFWPALTPVLLAFRYSLSRSSVLPVEMEGNHKLSASALESRISLEIAIFVVIRQWHQWWQQHEFQCALPDPLSQAAWRPDNLSHSLKASLWAHEALVRSVVHTDACNEMFTCRVIIRLSSSLGLYSMKA